MDSDTVALILALLISVFVPVALLAWVAFR